MNYQLCYTNLTESCRLRGLDKDLLDGYYEVHHILPRSLGGSNDESNLVLLTAREHFIAHRLLTKFTTGRARRKMLHALARMAWLKDKRKLKSRQYEVCRKANKESARLQQLKRAAEGTHHFQNALLRKANGKRTAARNIKLHMDGLHPMQKEENRKAQSVRAAMHGNRLVSEGRHHWKAAEHAEASRARGKALAASGLSPLLAEENRKASSERASVKLVCPHCGAEAARLIYYRCHGDKCPSLTSYILATLLATGETRQFKTMSLAETSLGVSNVAKVVAGVYKHAGGWHFKRIPK